MNGFSSVLLPGLMAGYGSRQTYHQFHRRISEVNVHREAAFLSI